TSGAVREARSTINCVSKSGGVGSDWMVTLGWVLWKVARKVWYALSSGVPFSLGATWNPTTLNVVEPAAAASLRAARLVQGIPIDTEAARMKEVRARRDRENR